MFERKMYKISRSVTDLLQKTYESNDSQSLIENAESLIIEVKKFHFKYFVIINNELKFIRFMKTKSDHVFGLNVTRVKISLELFNKIPKTILCVDGDTSLYELEFI